LALWPLQKNLSRPQLVEALKIQVKENLSQSKHRLIGEILREKEYITTAQINAVLESMDIFEA